MSAVQAGLGWEHAGMRFWGLSLSGIRTCISMPEHSLAFDVAQAYPFALNLKKFFITHGHLDHAAGIPYIISQKAMLNQPAPDFYMPASLVEPMHKIMQLWMQIEGHTYNYQFHAVEPDQEIEINQAHFVKPFPSVHRIESLGYTLFHRNKKLKAEFRNLKQDEICQIKDQGRQLHDIIEAPLVSFTGDTQIEFLKTRDWIGKSKILFLETTYIDERKSVEHARKWGHTHLDELLPYLSQIQSEKIVLIHLSSRYSTVEALKILSQKIPQEFRDRVELFPGR